jgi:membrane-associated protein
MSLLSRAVDLFLHLDKHLDLLLQDYGGWTYAVLFVVVFCETGLVVTPFLPGDSLLFAAGALSARGGLDPWVLFVLLSAAAVLGDTVNYQIGHALGPRVLRDGGGRFLKPEYLDRTHRFFEKYGGKTIILARFVPIVRTFAPFVAGVGSMTYRRFLAFNVVGGVLWVGLFVSVGRRFADLPVVRENFTLVILAIIVLSILPGLFEIWRHRRETARSGPPPGAPGRR